MWTDKLIKFIYNHGRELIQMDLSYKSCRGSPRQSVRQQRLTQSVAPDAKRHDRDVDRNSDVMNDVAVLDRGMLEHGLFTNIFIIITVW